MTLLLTHMYMLHVANAANSTASRATPFHLYMNLPSSIALDGDETGIGISHDRIACWLVGLFRVALS